jgi:hypothetical protein
MNTLNSKTEVTEEGGDSTLGLPPRTDSEPVTREPGQTATHAVLFTPELLCNVISQLPLADILITTGVCHFWRNAVAADPPLQEALFLSPGEIRMAVIVKQLADVETQNILSLWEPGRILPWQMCYVLGNFHPFFRKICGVSPMTYLTLKAERGSSTCRVPTFEFPHGNWRRMFISQPPCKSIFMGIMSLEGMCGVTYDDADGIRLGGLYDKMVSKFSSDESIESMRLPGTDSQPSNDPKFHIMTIIEGFCERGVGTTTEIMEVPVQGGFARWPKDPVWLPKVEERSNVVGDQVPNMTADFAE